MIGILPEFLRKELLIFCDACANIYAILECDEGDSFCRNAPGRRHQRLEVLSVGRQITLRKVAAGTLRSSVSEPSLDGVGYNGGTVTAGREEQGICFVQCGWYRGIERIRPGMRYVFRDYFFRMQGNELPTERIGK